MNSALAAPTPLDLLQALEAEGMVTRTALLLRDPLSPEQFAALGSYLGGMQDSVGFWIGDLVRFGEAWYGQRAAQLLEAAGRSPDALQRYVRVAERVPPSRRREGLSWSHHREVAALEPAEQDEWLARAEAHDWTRRELEAHLRHADEDVEDRQPCTFCGGTGWVVAA